MGQPHRGFALADGARSGAIIHHGGTENTEDCFTRRERRRRFFHRGLHGLARINTPVIPSRARNLCCSCRFQFGRFLARLPMNSCQLRLKFSLPRWSVSSQSRRAQSAPGGSRSTRAAARIGSLALFYASRAVVCSGSRNDNCASHGSESERIQVDSSLRSAMTNAKTTIQSLRTLRHLRVLCVKK
jgi:hypothetical protein